MTVLATFCQTALSSGLSFLTMMPHSLIVAADQMPFTGLTLCRSIRHDHPKSIGASRIDGFGFHQQPVRVA